MRIFSDAMIRHCIDLLMWKPVQIHSIDTMVRLDLMFLFAQKILVLGGRHELFHLSGSAEVDHGHPAFAIGIGIDGLGMIFEVGIDLRNGAAYRRVDGGGGFGRFHFADLLAGRDCGAQPSAGR